MRSGAVGVLLGVFLLAGCSALTAEPSPVTTYTDASGSPVTVDWVDYPAHAGVDGEPLIGHPDQAGLEPLARDVMNGVGAAVTAKSGIALEHLAPEGGWFSQKNWYPQSGNGYGGDSMLTTVNCCELQSETAPHPADWQAVFDAASEATRAAGLGGLVLDRHTEDCNGEDACWLWSATATDGVQWVYFSIQDRTKDASGDAAREAERFDWPLRSISVGYGATVVEAGAAEDFTRAMEPFLGLERPAPTTSD